MRIALVCNAFPPEFVGGVEVVVQAHPLKQGEKSSEPVTVRVADGKAAEVELVLGRR